MRVTLFHIFNCAKAATELAYCLRFSPAEESLTYTPFTRILIIFSSSYKKDICSIHYSQHKMGIFFFRGEASGIRVV